MAAMAPIASTASELSSTTARIPPIVAAVIRMKRLAIDVSGRRAGGRGCLDLLIMTLPQFTPDIPPWRVHGVSQLGTGESIPDRLTGGHANSIQTESEESLAYEDHGTAPAENDTVFGDEVRRLRERARLSQKALGQRVGYSASFISKVETSTIVPADTVASALDEELQAGGELMRLFDLLEPQRDAVAVPRGRRPEGPDLTSPRSGLIVVHEDSKLTYQDGVYTTEVRRTLRNYNPEPRERYLIRVMVDRYPYDAERSNAHYRRHPLRWEEIDLEAYCGDERMDHEVKLDRDAAKEIWLLFRNREFSFPLMQGQETTIRYRYSVPETKWGPWWQRAMRYRTLKLSLTLDFPLAREPRLSGRITGAGSPRPFNREIPHEDEGDRRRFTWVIDGPPDDSRVRIDWRMKPLPEEVSEALSPAEQMAEMGILQAEHPALQVAARPFELPGEADEAARVVDRIRAAMDRVSLAHTFAKGMGMAAPQIGIDRAVAVIRPAEEGTEEVILLNPQVIDESAKHDIKYEGCLSFFDVRGKVSRPVRIDVEHQRLDGSTEITSFFDGMARHVCHEIDHLEGRLYTARMPKGAELIPLSEYRGTGQAWS